MKKSFDLIVIGAGSGGLAAAKRAAKYGARVAIIEGDRVGGTCVIRGCVPKKLLVYGSFYKGYIDNAPEYGVNFKEANIDSSVLLKNVRSEVDRLNLLHIDFLEKFGVQLFEGWASFIDSHNILIQSEKSEHDNIRIFGTTILIAIGGEPYRPKIPGSELALVSDDIFLLKKLPREVIIVGAGFIACEFACILNNLGVKVKQLIRGQELLRGFDYDLSKTLQEQMESNGIDIIFNDFPASVESQSKSLIVKTNSQEVYKTEEILFATGRKPRLKGLNLEAAGVLVDNNNRVPTDKEQRTNIENIYAVGDVTNHVNLTPVAVEEGRAFSDSIYGNKPHLVNYQFVPKAVFSQPEIASVGLTEQESIDFHGRNEVDIYSAKFRSMSHALSKRGGSCLLKLVVLKSNNKILGCHMVGEHSSEIIQMATISLLMGATKSDFDRSMALHPTIAEEFVTMNS